MVGSDVMDTPEPRAGGPAPEPPRSDVTTRTVYATDNSIYQVVPAAVATPSSPDDVAALLAANHRRPVPRPVVARGGGTGTNGQSLTDGLIIDVKRHLNRLIDVDPAARTAVVEPGIVTAELNNALAQHGLFWAPHTSTLNRATVGGMIATDAAGKGSLVHGRAHRHVIAVDLCLADGTAVHLAPTTVSDAEHLAKADGAAGRLWHALLELAIPPDADAVSFGLPELARGFSGYGIDRFRRDDLLDPVQLVVGAEGSLGVVTRAWLRLTPLPTHTTMVVATYDSFLDALDDSVALAVTTPTAIEVIDETTFAAARDSPAWAGLTGPPAALFEAQRDEQPTALLVLEYAAHDPVDATHALDLLAAAGHRRAAVSIDDAPSRAAVWKVRADAVGHLARLRIGRPERTARPTAMVEDCAVPVQSMSSFIASFRQLLDDAGLTYGMFGHADVGCVHVRPALDLTCPDHRALVETLTSDVVDLVVAHGGILWGEHGRGFRGAYVDTTLPGPTIDVMRAVKSAFDPDDLCNPGKLYRPLGSAAPLLAVDAPPLRADVDRTVPVDVRRRFDGAFACNGNGLCHDHDPHSPMCPSYVASGDPALSPKGRSDLIRAWLARSAPGGVPNRDADVQLAENLGWCLSCAACTGQCPVHVDIPGLKSQFLDRYHRTVRRPLAHHVLSHFEPLARGARVSPTLASRAVAPLGRFLGLVDLPAPHRRPRRGLPRFDVGTNGVLRRRGRRTAHQNPDVVLLPDVFTSVLEPETLHAAYDVLTAVGYTVAVAPFVPSGKFDHVVGRRERFATAARRQRELVSVVAAAGARPVVIEPAVSLLHTNDYPSVLGDDGGDDDGAVVATLAELLVAAPAPISPASRPSHVTLLGHCTERAITPEERRRWQHVLELAGHEVTVADVGCCGMAGVFGHEADRQEMSRRLWDLSWADAVGRAAPGTATATGYSCRSQARRFMQDQVGTDIVHPIHVLAQALPV